VCLFLGWIWTRRLLYARPLLRPSLPQLSHTRKL
jgi:hypothetical protein